MEAFEWSIDDNINLKSAIISFPTKINNAQGIPPSLYHEKKGQWKESNLNNDGISSSTTAISSSADHTQKKIEMLGIEEGVVEYKPKGFGYIQALPDIRDLIYEPGRLTLSRAEVAAGQEFNTAKFPRMLDLRDKYDKKYPIMDQGDLGSCTGFSIASLLIYNNIKQNVEDSTPINDMDKFMPSPLFIYYNERVAINTVTSDSGAVIRDGIKSVVKLGACRESYWPYQIQKFTDKPNTQAYTEAKKHQAILYFKINNFDINNLKAVLVEGYPFVFGFSVYTSFMSSQVAKTGIVPLPKTNENLLGGHAVICVGYDDTRQVFICRNQWGVDWGDKGYFYMPYSYLTNTNLASDFWVIKRVEVLNDEERQAIVDRVLKRQLTKGKQHQQQDDDKE